MNLYDVQLLVAVFSHFRPVHLLVCVVAASLLVEVQTLWGAEAESRGTQLMYFGTYTGHTSKGIYVARFDPSTGKLTTPELAAETKNPTFLALDSEQRCLYAVNEINDFGEGHSGAVSAFSLDPKTGKLAFLNQQPSGGPGPCHLAVARNGACVLVANYVGGSVAVLPLGRDGRLSQPSSTIQHHGSSVNPQRQEGPHAHFITWDPLNRFVLTCDLGLDQVLFYQLKAPQLVLAPHDSPAFAVKPGSGPRHLAFSQSGRYAYLLNEMASTLIVCSYNSQRGELTEIQSVSTLPEDFRGENTCAEVALHPTGKFIYTSNRGHNSIAVFAVDAATGMVRPLQHQPTQGKTPRHFLLEPGGRWLIAENQDSDNVVVLAIDGQSGRLASTGITQTIGAPVCAVFVDKK